jgi:uncharacterized protein (TIGR02246 family)
MKLSEQERIREIYTATTAALHDGDIRALAAYYTDDAIQFPPDRAPLVGWTEISTSLEKELDGITFDSTLDVAEIVVAGEWAYACGNFRAIVTPTTPGASPMLTSGSFLDVFRRLSDGSWKIARSAWSNHQLEE